MNWVLEHFQIILAVAAAIAYWLNQRRQAAAEKELETPRKVSDAAEQAERTRHVQEEIRRKIAERRGGGASAPGRVAPESVPPLVRPSPVPPLDPFSGPMRRLTRTLEQPAEPPPAPREPDAETKAILARQAQLAEQMRALEAARQAEQQRAAASAAQMAAAFALPPASSWTLEDVRARLRDPHETRRAIVLREILGSPVGLR